MNTSRFALSDLTAWASQIELRLEAQRLQGWNGLWISADELTALTDVLRAAADAAVSPPDATLSTNRS